MILLMALFSSGNFLLYAYGIQKTTAMTGQLLYAFSPLLTMAGGLWLHKERLNLINGFGVAL